jgi:hypothetical protein
MRILFAAACVPFIGMSIFAAFALNRAEAGACSLTVGISSYNPLHCRVVVNETQTLIEWPAGANRTHRFRLVHGTSDKAEGFWNGLRAEGGADQQLGVLVNSGSCWRGERAQICFSSIESPEGPAGPDTSSSSKLGEALRGLSGGQSMTCWHSQEDAMPPQVRLTARSMALSDYTGHLEREHTFTQFSSGEIFRDGTAVDVLYRANEQESWRAAQELLGGLVAGLDQSMGMDRRIYVLNFRDRTAYLATLNPETDGLEQVQQIPCL